MAASVAVPGFASVLQVGSTILGTNGTSVTYTTVGEIDNISGPSITRNAINVSHMESPGGWEEYKPGMVDAGEITLDVNLILGGSAATNTNHVAVILNTLVRNNPTNAAGIGTSLSRNFRIFWPDTVTAITSSTNKWTVDGFVSAFSPSAPHNDKLAASVTIKCTGELLFT